MRWQSEDEDEEEDEEEKEGVGMYKGAAMPLRGTAPLQRDYTPCFRPP